MPTTDVVAQISAAKPLPHHLVVAVENHDDVKVSIPNVRNRWSRVDAVLAQLQWTKITACDRSGATVAIYTRPDDAAPPPAAAEPSTSTSTSTVTVRERDLLELVERANDRAVQRALEAADRTGQRFDRMVTALFDAMRLNLDATAQLSRMLGQQVLSAPPPTPPPQDSALADVLKQALPIVGPLLLKASSDKAAAAAAAAAAEKNTAK